MRKSKVKAPSQISILTVDDDPIITSTIKDYFERSGYDVDIENNPVNAIEKVRNGKYDIMLLDFLMTPICGDQVVEEIRKFNKDLFIVLLTGHKSMAPPIKTIRQLDIQGYYEKDDRFDQLELWVESCVKSIKQLREIRAYQENIAKAYMQTIETLRYVVETRDSETRGHSERVSKLAGAIALQMGFDTKEKELIETAGLFHDIGKVGVPDSILLKNGKLTDEEYDQIKLHPSAGEKILSTYTPFKDILPIVRQHHERYGGGGYPDGLAGDEICPGARVISVADSFDAMVSNRTYRKGLGIQKAIEELKNGSSKQFDAEVVKAFLALIESTGIEEFNRLFYPLSSTDGGDL
ncbi:MAG: HD domain-containing protein [Clostridia bacterium]|nr:HD domain-containing protein [Clostridia bacterium]